MTNRVRTLMCTAALLAGSQVAAGEIYSYVDAAGVAHFTDVPTEERRWQVVATSRPESAPIVSKLRRSRRARRPARLQVPAEFQRHIGEAARLYNIPAELIKAVMAVESAFRPGAVSSAGARGLMQLMPQTAQLMQVQNPFDPRQSIMGGTRFLRYLADRLDGDLVLTVAAYNAGLQAVLKYGGIPPFRETRRYVKRVIGLYDALLADQGRLQADRR